MVPSNMSFINATLPESNSSAWLKASAWSNMEFILLTLATSQSSGWLNASQAFIIDCILITDPVCRTRAVG